MSSSLGSCCVFVEYDVPTLLGIHLRKTLHKVPYLFPFIVVAFEEVGAVLNGYNYPATL